MECYTPEDRVLLQETPPSLYYEQAMLNMCRILSLALDMLCAEKFRKRKKNLVKNAQPWPLNVADIFPDRQGCVSTIHSLMGWAKTGPGGYGPYGPFIAALVTYWESLGREILR
ncbi:hypothetical protein C8R44DRAFT_873574 [Mycena epipterygia]|nr:hypothetical protein C8R44DRAFT_873574 [Mycena epipterygia]